MSEITQTGGYLDVVDATLRAPRLEATSNIGIANTNPEHAFSVGSNLYVSTESSNVLTVDGNVVCEGVKVGLIEIIPSYDLAAVSNVGNVTQSTIQFANATTGFTTTANVEIGGNITLTANAQVKVDSNVVTEYTGPHDRPLRKYPEVAMATGQGDGYTQDGYTVEESSNYGIASHKLSNAFDHKTGSVSSGDSWLSGQNTYANDGTALNASSPDTFQSIKGSWIGIRLPKKIKLSHIHLYNFDFGITSNRPPKTGIVWASNNSGSSWNRINDFSCANQARNGLNAVNVNSTRYYDWYRVQITEMVIDGSYTNAVSLQEVEFYGYEEGSGSLDTTLKSVYNVPATTGTQLEVYYDGQDYTADTDFDQANEVLDKSGNNLHGSQTGGVGFDSTYKAFTFNGTSQNMTTTLANSGTPSAYVHTFAFWTKPISNLANNIQQAFLQLGPHSSNSCSALRLEESTGLFRWFFHTNDIVYSASHVMLGEWNHIVAAYDGGSEITSRRIWVNGHEIHHTSTSGTIGALSLSANAPLSIGSLNGPNTYFNGSIANFRLYSKALNADQVKELYHYQKDYFLGSKSQLTIYKGHLGVGVTEPSGQLELAGDERIQEYPPRAFETSAGVTGPDDLYIEGHGHFKAWSTSYYVPGGTNYTAGGAFTKSNSHTYDSWISGQNWENGPNASSPSTGLPTASAPTFAGYKGGHLILELPYSILLKSFRVDERLNLARQLPSVFVIIASNDGINWDTIFNHTATAGIESDYAGNIFSVNATKTYSQYGFVALKNGNTNYNDHIAVGEWRLFGTPGPTTLDKGSLSLTRSLDVPRVSRYDVDTETPRPEKLVLDFDTTVNSSPTDISGKGNHGVRYANAQYSPADKAFKFDGTDDVLHVNGAAGTPTGDAIYTISCWVKTGATQVTTNPSIIYFGSAWATSQLAGIYFRDGNKVAHDVGSTNVYTTNPTIIAERWHHIVVVKRGTGNIGANTTYQGIFVDGVEITQLSIDGTPRQQTILTGNQQISIGHGFNGTVGANGAYGTVGLISKPQIWNVALEPSEVKKLYNLGRTGRSMVISDTAVGIGKTPEANLDVRGSLAVRGVANFGSRVGIGTTNPGYNLVVHNNIDSSIQMEISGSTAGETSTTLVLKDRFNHPTPRGSLILYHRGNNTQWSHGPLYNSTLFGFKYNSSTAGYDNSSTSASNLVGYLSTSGSDQNMNNFTGQHRCFIKNVPFNRANELEGLIVSSDQNKYIKMSRGIEAGSNAITMNESLPVVSLSIVVTDKKCFGVISASEDPEKRFDTYGCFGTPFDKEEGDTRVYINSVGEGAIWVVNTNGSLEAGDYITTSNVTGYGQKQDSEFLANYTVAKITMDCDFDPATQPIQIIKKELQDVNYWVNMTYENVSEEQYSNLTDENRRIVDGIYQKIIKEESKTEQEGYELEVRQELANVLDEHGQIQWEDHPTETEKAYKIRYLDADGNITDEANHVYKAAFVGCTYHCG